MVVVSFDIATDVVLYNMKVKFLILVFSLFSVNANSQYNDINGAVLSAEGSPIAYATISTLDFKYGIYTNLSGEFRLTLPDSIAVDSLVISALGFESINVPYFDSIKPYQIFLNKSIEILEKVEIVSSRTKTIEIGSISKRPEAISMFSYKSWSRRLGRVLKVSKYQEGTIESVKIYVAKQGVRTTPFRVRFYQMLSTETGPYPAKEIVFENITSSASKKGKWVEIDVSKYAIPITSEGVLISIEWLYDKSDAYSYELNLNYDKEKDSIKSVQTGWGGSWGCEKVSGEDGAWVTNQEGTWIYRIVPNSNSSNVQPMVKAIVKY